MPRTTTLSLARFAATTVLACAAALSGLNAQAQGVRAESPTAAIDQMIAAKRAELKELQQRKRAVGQATKEQKRAADIARAEARLEALRAGKPAART